MDAIRIRPADHRASPQQLAQRVQVSNLAPHYEHACRDCGRPTKKGVCRACRASLGATTLE